MIRRCEVCGSKAVFGRRCLRHELTMYEGLPDNHAEAIVEFERRMKDGYTSFMRREQNL